MISCLLALSILLFLYGTARKYQNENLKGVEKKEHKLYFLYPVIGFWLAKIKYFQKEPVKKKLELYRMLHPGLDEKKLFYLATCQRFSVLYSLLVLTVILCLLVKASSHVVILDQYLINRPSAGMPEETQQISVILKERERQTEADFTITIPGREYRESEISKYQEEAKAYIFHKVRGKNHSLDKVTEKLNLMSKVPGNPFSVSWILDGQKLVDENGTVHNKEMKEKQYITIEACLTYKNIEQYVQIPLGIEPHHWTWEEKAKADFLDNVDELNEKRKENKQIKLPGKVGKVQVKYVKEQIDKSGKIAFAFISGCVGLWIYWEEALKKKKKKYKQECQYMYPQIVYKLTLLLGAGMTLKGAWKRIVEDYAREKKLNRHKMYYAYEEMILTWNEIQNGVSEVEAFGEFGKRMKLRCYLRLSSLITQNMKKGTKGFLSQLEGEAREAQEERKQLARKLGEEASSKLLFPMIIMLLIVLLIVMVPAFLSFSKGGL